jgi:hypothetical protein
MDALQSVTGIPPTSVLQPQTGSASISPLDLDCGPNNPVLQGKTGRASTPTLELGDSNTTTSVVTSSLDSQNETLQFPKGTSLWRIPNIRANNTPSKSTLITSTTNKSLTVTPGIHLWFPTPSITTSKLRIVTATYTPT